MTGGWAGTDSIDYLQRSGPLRPQLSGGLTAGAARTRRLLRINGIGRLVREPDARLPPDERWHSPMTGVLTGLYGYRIPVAYLLVGDGSGDVQVQLGIWAARDTASPEGQDRRRDVLASIVRGMHSHVALEEVTPGPLRLPLGGLALGIPGTDGIDSSDGSAPADRIIQSLAGARWAVLVLAYPVAEQAIGTIRAQILNEIRAVASAVTSEGSSSPLADTYIGHLNLCLAALSEGMGTGAWRSAAYLLGDGESYPRLAAAWRSVFAVRGSIPEPVRVFDRPEVERLANGWAMPDDEGAPGPGYYRRPFEFQTLLSTAQLASCVHLPELEVPGFSVRPAPAFAVSRQPPRDGQAALDLGTIIDQRLSEGTRYRIERDQLTRHTFVCGLTGSGKTNTIMHLLAEAASADIPFLVIEPAKTEYREMLGRQAAGQKIRVFTIGRESVAPLRLNPFEVPPGIDVSTHLDLLKAVFMGSMALWIPLPQVLEQCLIELYTERGWSFSTAARSGEDQPGSPDSPTLGELVAAVERLVPTLGFKPDTTQEITAALTTRLNALRRGARGLMLDVIHSVPMAELLEAPTVIELEGLGDDADKAFVMGLLLTRLYEHRRAEHARELAAHARAGKPLTTSSVLSHIVVVEEAHRLLGAARKTTDAWHADPQGAFGDTFSQMLAEVRAYGQAMIVADQVPVRLTPDVLKNTNLKVVHRIVAGDDRDVMAAAMSMTPAQSRQLALLTPGLAAVFSEGDHMPAIVHVPKAKDLLQTPAIDDATVAAAMASWRADPAVAAWFTAGRGCVTACRDPELCQAGRRLAEAPAARLLAARLFHTAIEHPDGLDAVWPDAEAFAAARTPSHADPREMLHVLTAHAVADVIARRAIQAAWPPQTRAEFHDLMNGVISERVAATGRWLGSTPARMALVTAAAKAQRRAYDPFPLCGVVCPDGRCAFRHALLDAGVADYPSTAPSAVAERTASEAGIATHLAQQVIQISPAAPEGAAALSAARWRALACAAQQLTCVTEHPREGAERAAAAITEAGWPMAVPGESGAQA
jgi:Helicase HerA, central domain